MSRLLAIREELRERFPTLYGVPVAKKPPAPRIDPTAIILGRDPNRCPIGLPLRVRLEHCLIIGATGSGKTRLLLHYLRQSLKYGEGFAFLDPHGSHPDSAYVSLLPLCQVLGVKVHVIDFDSHLKLGFNPLYCPPGTDPSVIAGHNLEAISVTRDDESLAQKPSIERCLTTVFSTLADLGLTYVEAPMLLDREDKHGLRAYAIEHVKDPYTKDDLKWLHELAQDGRRKRDYEQEIIGPKNRLQRLLSPPALRVMLGQKDKFLDIQAAMDNGEPIIANLNGGSNVYEKSADLFGRLLVRSVLFHAARRKNTKPFTFMMDEAPRFLSGDIPILLGEVRKRGVSVVAAMQWLEQAGTDDNKILAALLNGTNVKVLFRGRDAEETERLAHSNIPIDIETPVKATIKPTVVGFKITRLKNESLSDQESVTQSVATMHGDSKGRSRSATESVSTTTGSFSGEAESHSTSDMHSAGHGQSHGTGEGDSAGTVMTPTGEYWHPHHTSAETEGSNSTASSGHSSSSAEGSATSDGTVTSHGSMESESHAYSYGVSKSEATISARTKGEATSRGTGRSAGFSEALEPILQWMPSAVHSKDALLYKAGLMLRSLPTGMAYVNYVGREGAVSTLFTVPPIFTPTIPPDMFVEMRDRIIAESPAAIPTEEAMKHIEERAQQFIDRKPAVKLKRPLIDTPRKRGTWG